MPESVPMVRDSANTNGVSAFNFAIPGSGGVLDAAWRIARSYPGRLKALAQRMEMPYETFQKKVNPSCETHHLQLEEAVDMQIYSGRADILHAMAAELGHVCIHIPDATAGEIGQRLMTVGAEVGDVFATAQRIMSDGKIEPDELRELTAQVVEAISALSSVLRAAR